MSIYLELFLVFLKIGVVSFGGGYGMISLIQQEMTSRGWIDAERLMSYIAIAESTPGPIAVNIATFVGSDQAGFFGSLVATIGIVLPAFLIIIVIAAVFKTFAKNRYVKSAFASITPVILGLILSTGLLMIVYCQQTGLLMIVYCLYAQYNDFDAVGSFDWVALAILVTLVICTVLYKVIRKRSMPPIATILLSAALGMLYFI